MLSLFQRHWDTGLVHASLGESRTKPLTPMAAHTRPRSEGPSMNRQHVTSSNISSVGYDPLDGTLEVEFHGGSIYQYSDVPASVYRDLLDAPSKGAYFNAHIRTTYPHRRLRQALP